MINSCLEKVDLDVFALMFYIHLSDIPYKLHFDSCPPAVEHACEVV